MFKNLYHKIINSDYLKRLAELSPLFLFFLILQSYIGITYIQNTDPIMTVLIRVNGLPIVYTKAIIAALAWSLIYILVISIPSNKVVQKILSIFITLFSIWIFFVEGFLLEAYGLGYTEETLTIALATNIQETQEFFETVFAIDKLIKPIIVFILAICSYLLSNQFYKKVKNKQTLKLITLYSVILLLFPSIYHLRGVYKRLSGTFLSEVSSPIERVMIGTDAYIKHQKAQREVAKKLHLNYPKVHLRKDIKDTKIVLIIGESLRRDYMHCYGYPLRNTPHLDSLINQKKAIPFTDVVAPAPNTIHSLEEVLSFHTQDLNEKKWHQYATLPQVFRSAGYWVQWTSNQEKTGSHNSVYMLAQTADSTFYLGTGSIGRYASKKQSLDE